MPAHYHEASQHDILVVMLSFFPQLFFLTPLAVALLRIAVGALFLCMAWRTLQSARAMAQIKLPIIGVPPVWLMQVTGAIIGVVGIALVIGLATQLAAIAGAVIAMKRIGLGRRYDTICPLVHSTNILIFVICIALLCMGAGSLAFDLPL